MPSISPARQAIEEQVERYFSQLKLPEHLTLYDAILLSLRQKDFVFTFNWDPFLFDAYERLRRQRIPLPKIHHLHGNVRVGFCRRCGVSEKRGSACETCGDPLTPSRLLYPVDQKNYASDAFISSQWAIVEKALSDAWYVTIFGYSAPKTDQEAIRLFTNAWKKGGEESKLFERLEIIDIRDDSELEHQWWEFSHLGHFDVRSTFSDSVLAMYPRRSCEALYYMGMNGDFVEPIPWGNTFDELRDWAVRLAAYE